MSNENLVSIGRDSTEIKLFDTKGGVVKIYSSMTVDQQTKIIAKYGDKDDAESKAMIAVESIIACFISWNIGKDGEKLPCNADTLKQFSQRDLLAMLQACTGRQMVDENGVMLTAEEAAKKAGGV